MKKLIFNSLFLILICLFLSFVVTKKKQNDTPVGSIISYAGDVSLLESKGWLVCKGQSLSTKNYTRLYKAIGNSWGGDNRGERFNLPDLRGYFLRGVSEGVNTDPDKLLRTARFQGGNTGNNVGSYQDDLIETHIHKVEIGNDGKHKHPIEVQKNNISGTNKTRDVGSGGGKWNSDPNIGSISVRIPKNSGGHDHDIKVGAPSVKNGRENRPKNAYVYYLIKVK